MIGYNGSGYKGLQLDHKQKTIEGEIFQAFVKAGAISKANADEPKKSSFGRCARTDKGVHAAGNLLSLKLIIEDPEIVAKINDNLSPQIRVWGIQRTNNSFSAYQMVDSRVYEYLIPTSSFLPPHPKSYLGRKIKESAEENKDIEEWRKRQEEVESYWEDVDEREINPILEKLDDKSRQVVHKALFPTEEDLQGILQAESSTANEPPATVRADVDKVIARLTDETWIETNKREIASGPAPDTELNMMHHTTEQDSASDQSNLEFVKDAVEFHSSHKPASTGQSSPAEFQSSHELASTGLDSTVTDSSIAAINTPSPSQVAIKDLRAAYISAKRAYRIHPRRLERVKDAFKLYQGTKNFHNYTVGKHYRDPSSKRIIKSFTVNPEPIIINGTEWLSLKVHGQSFMMHQIRKMVSMVALVVRCGCDPERIVQTYGSRRVGIPKAPGLGLLLERPVFDSYNSRCKDYGRDPIDFGNHEQQINEFKQKSIYEKIYQDEERENVLVYVSDDLSRSYLTGLQIRQLLQSSGQFPTKGIPFRYFRWLGSYAGRGLGSKVESSVWTFGRRRL